MTKITATPSFVANVPADQAPIDNRSGMTDGGRRRGGGLFFLSALVSQASALLRYMVLARLLGPEQLGIAATLIVTASFFDLISDTGSDRFIIQDREGGTEQVQNLVQAVYAGRGVMIALALLVFAFPIAKFYHTPQLAGGFAILAISPFINGFQHLDNRRTQRDHDFRPEAISITLGELVGLGVSLVAAWLVRDFTAVLYGVIARTLVLVVTSHIQAKRPYSVGWDKAHAPRLARFSMPLMLNGLMLFVVSQGDRVIVGHELGVKALGYYSAIMLLIYYPASLISRFMVALNIPLISMHWDEPKAREHAADTLGSETFLLTIAMAAGFAVVAPMAVPLLFGGRFTQDPLVVGLIGCLQAARFLLMWPTTVALALGRSTTVLLSNLAHGFAFAGALAGLKLLGGLTGLVSGFLAGELLAGAVALVLVNRNLDRELARQSTWLWASAITFGLIVAWNLALRAHAWGIVAGLAAASFLLAEWLRRRERGTILEVLVQARRIATTLSQRLKARLPVGDAP